MILPVNISGVENSRNENMMSNFEIALTSYLQREIEAPEIREVMRMQFEKTQVL